MKIPGGRSCISLIVLSALVEAIRANENETSTTEHRQGRGRIVKLYSGYKPDPVLCTEEGFKADPVVCSVFYRCTKSSSGKFTIFKFQCGPGTVYDPETEVCNHPSSTKRSECGGIKAHVEQDNDNEIEQPELPSPISTIVPIYTGHASNGTSYTTYKVPSLDSSDEFKQSTENGYINPFSISPTPYHEETTKGQIQISTTANFSILEKRQPCTSDGFMGDSENCKKFYRCVSNLRGGYIRYEFECSEPTVWDDHLQSCNHPWAVRSRRCGRAGISYENHTETYPNSEKSTDELDERFGAKLPPNSNEDNGDFNKISSNYGDRLNYVDNKYSTEKEQINYESHFNQPSMSNKDTNVETDANLFHYDDTSNNYGQKITEPATNSSTYSEIGSKFSCTRSGFVGDPSDCKKFYRCIENGKGSFTKYEFTCSQGTVWDKKVEACNYAWAVKECGSTSEINNLLSTDGNPSISASSLSENIDSGYINQNNQEHEPPTTVTISTTVTLTSTTNSNQSPKPENLPENNDYSNTYGSQQYATSSKPDIEVVKTTLSPLTNQRSDCKTTGFIGDDNDCKKFYRCVDNGRGGFIKHEFSCGEGTVWDPEIEACNHAWAVKHCGSSIPSKDASSSIANTPSFVSPNIDLGMSTTISSIQTSTPQREINEYDSGYGQQQGISSKKPDFYIETTTLKQIQDQTHNNCQQSGFIGDTNDCKTFYRCVDNGNGGFIKHEFTCGEGTVWDPDIEACNHASVVKHCGGSVPPNENILTSSTPNINVEDPHNGYITDNYIENEDTTPKTTTTTTTRFPPTNTVTEKSEITSSLSDTYSSSTTIRTQSTSISNEITKTNNDCKSSGFMGDNNDCQKFYRCVDNGNGGFIKYEFMCGEGTVWDSKIEACNHKWAVEKCGGNLHSHEVERTTTTASHSASPVTESEVNKATSTHSVTYSSSSTTSISTTPKSTTKQPSIENMECNSEGYFANPHDCTKFYRCVNEGESGYTKYEFSCAEGTAWDENTVSCNYINEVKACHSNQPPNTNTATTKPVYDDQITESDTTKTTSTSSPTTASTSTTAPASATSTTTTTTSTTSTTTTTTNKPKPGEQYTCKEEGYFGDTRDCKKFYRCVAETDGKFTKYDFDCGDGTIWDQDIVTCNHPRDVKNPSCKSESQSTSPDSTTWSSTTNSETPITNKPSSTTTHKPSSTTTREPSSTTREPSSTTTDKPISTSTTSEVPSNKNETNSNCTTENDNKNFTCTKAGFYADPSNCKKFYRCVDWENDGKKFSIYHFECSEGTIWDPALETCNHEESVYPPRNCNCTESSSNTTTPSTTEKTTTQSTTTKNPTTQSSTTEKSTTQSSTTQKTAAPTSNTQESTTQSSTTQETTSATSTTQESTTHSSTTEESTTHSSTTEESTTQSSTTQSSTTEESTTQSSTTEESTTQSSTTQSSTTDESTTQSPTTQSSTTEESTTQSSTTQSSTTEESTTQSSTTQSSTTEESTTQSSTTEESTTQSSTTEESTTQSSTTQSSTTEESTTQSSTTEETTTQSTTDQTSTTESSSNKECPDTANDQYLYVCPTSFRRHPKYCNLFYQCTDDNDSHEPKIAVFHCPNNTIYDESKVQCVEEKKSSKKCKGQISQKHRVKRLGADHTEPFIVTKEKMACLNTGYFPFEKQTNCSPALLKCELTKSGELRGLVYRCPDDFVYWNKSRRCEPLTKVRDCKRSTYPWKRRYDIPLERFNIATET